jgi:uncharacterized repeat protein (TIGR03803 family)
MDVNLKNVTVLKSFNSANNGENTPQGGLLLIGNVLYGTLVGSGYGGIFSYNKNNAAYTFFSFSGTGPTGDIRYPKGTLCYDGANTIYGCCSDGGGYVYSISLSFTNFTEFNPGVNSITDPRGLILYNNVYYGICQSGAGSDGAIYSLTGSTFAYIYEFNALAATNGKNPHCNLLNINGKFYGTCQNGGTNNNGTVFSFTLSGGSYKLLYTFSALSSLMNIDGAKPESTLVTFNNKLYGTCRLGGINGNGTVFSLNLDGTGFTTLFSFNNTNGSEPFSPFLVNNSLYGITYSGGSSGFGVAYSLVVYTPITPAFSNVCFPAGTPITTDSGVVAIEKLDVGSDTIRGNPIVAITQTVTMDNYLVCFDKGSLGLNCPSTKTIMSKNHRVFYMGAMVEAYKFLRRFTGVKKVGYVGEVLYNVLLEKHGIMVVNNMICETLHPKNLIAKLYTSDYSSEYKNKIVVIMNDSVLKNDVASYKRIVDRV